MTALKWLAVPPLLLLAACSAPTGGQRLAEAEQTARAGGLRPLAVESRLPVAAWGRLTPESRRVHVYLEGDGTAWRGGGRPALDPTPRYPVALRLAAQDEHEAVLYLGRPCQYRMEPSRGCHFSVWTSERFAHVAALEEAIGQWLGPERELVLVGFSGGANMAVQLAARLPNVVGLITVAGNLDAEAFRRYHRLPAEAYGNNAALLGELAQLPQLHYSGGQDRVIPPGLSRQQLAPVLAQGHCAELAEGRQADHQGPWVIEWGRFEQLLAACKTER
ncbi:alpha/beta hydrolase family protein [Zobellella denitrificans]